MQDENKRYYLHEFAYFDGEYDITFNIIDVNTDKMTIYLAISKCGKISVVECDLKQDKFQDLYFEYGIDRKNISLNDFEKIED